MLGRIAAAMMKAKKSRPRTSRSFQSASARTMIEPATSVTTAARRAVSLRRRPFPGFALCNDDQTLYEHMFARYNGLSMAAEELVVHGAREHNLKDITVRLPRNALICITGLSGSGKSSLAFDTIYAEGQRRYVESLSAYARQFLQMMEKPDVDSIDGLSPAISIDQKTTSRNPRSTVGTVTEIYDYLRLLYARVGPAALPGLRAADLGPVDRLDRRADPHAARGHALHGQRADRARPQGRVQGSVRGAAQRGLHTREGRR